MDDTILIVVGTTFIKYKDELYIYGSESNLIYEYKAYCMGKIKIVAFIQEKKDSDYSKFEKLNVSIPNVEFIFYSYPKSLRERIGIIKKEVKNCSLLAVKLPLKDSLIACHYALKYKKRFLVESGGAAGISLKYHGGSIKYKLAAFPIEFLTKKYHKKATYIIYVSRFYLQRLYPCKCKNISCPDVILPIPNELSLIKRIEKLKNHSSKYVLGLVGVTQAEYRGHDTLIKVAKKLIDDGYDVQIKFLGGGSADDKRKRLAKALNIESQIEFCGRLKHEDVLLWYDDIDVLVMPTLAETLGRSIVEAMSRGCPVIGSYETAIPEQIGSDCITWARDEKGIVEIVERMITNKFYFEACIYENFYRSMKYASEYTNEIRKKAYNEFRKEFALYNKKNRLKNNKRYDDV